MSYTSSVLLVICLAIAQVDSASLHTKSTSTWSPRCPSVFGKIPRLIPDPTDCRSMFLCGTQGTSLHYYCPNGLVFDASRQECLQQNTCRRDFGEYTAFTSCPKQNGKDIVSFPHPTDCQMYYVCDHGTAYPKRCPSKLHYNEHLRVCDWPDNAKCKARIFSLQS